MTDVSERRVLDTLAAMTAESVARCGLDANSLVAARIAALAAVGAPAASYLMHVGPAMDAGVTVEQIQDILIAVAPIVGTPRTMDAALNVAEALGIVIAVVEDELEAEEGRSNVQATVTWTSQPMSTSDRGARVSWSRVTVGAPHSREGGHVGRIAPQE